MCAKQNPVSSSYWKLEFRNIASQNSDRNIVVDCAFSGTFRKNSRKMLGDNVLSKTLVLTTVELDSLAIRGVLDCTYTIWLVNLFLKVACSTDR